MNMFMGNQVPSLNTLYNWGHGTLGFRPWLVFLSFVLPLYCLSLWLLFFGFPKFSYVSCEWVSEWWLFNANSAIYQAYYGENKIIVNEIFRVVFCRPMFVFGWSLYCLSRFYLRPLLNFTSDQYYICYQPKK